MRYLLSRWLRNSPYVTTAFQLQLRPEFYSLCILGHVYSPPMLYCSRIHFQRTLVLSRARTLGHVRASMFDLYVHLHRHFDRHTGKSAWDLPPGLQTASHRGPIRLSLDTQRCKNNTAALKQTQGGKKRQGSQKHFCLFLMGHPHKLVRGYLSQIHREKTFQLTAMIEILAAKNNKKYCWS